ncbi:hypothetical protein [Haloplanus halobius]|uniref:hypothetical protein n=1 Tax=Haloplanus halobius TaxID=2934938 RepID=UPI00200CB36C|nr:hypothetical protein [Haloplanus sp. XH21]
MATLRDLLTAAKIDLVQLLAAWREIVFSPPDEYPPESRWRPESPGEHLAFWTWSLVGAVLIGVVYPFAALGFWVRYVGRQIDRVVAGLGILVIVGVVAVIWGGLTAVAWNRLPAAGFRAVLAASVVATVSVGLSWVAARHGPRRLTLVLGYPFAVAAVLLPPVTAALFSPTLGSVVLPGSTSLAEWLLDNVLAVGGLNTIIRQQFDLTGFAFVGMWFGFAVPLGWALGLLVTLADTIRPHDRR